MKRDQILNTKTCARVGEVDPGQDVSFREDGLHLWSTSQILHSAYYLLSLRSIGDRRNIMVKCNFAASLLPECEKGDPKGLEWKNITCATDVADGSIPYCKR